MSKIAVSYLQAILELGYQRVLGDEGEECAAPCEWQWDDKSHEDDHFGHQQEEDLEGYDVSRDLSMTASIEEQ